ncbi:DUF2073 domain-containing protein [Candidatus Woesearchaeota archaeon]|nr:DUF2073 domain-containing protein [Candidatus Woesearchaeota archaeon]
MLTLQIVPYGEIHNLGSDDRIKKLMKIVKDDKIVLMQGRLEPEEETGLIQKTMEEVKKSFRGIEICTIYPEEHSVEIFDKLRSQFAKMLLGNREGITIIGPANIVKEIRRDPNKIQLYTFNKSPRRKRK